MDDAELAAREHDNFIAAIGMIARFRPNGIVRHEGGVALLASGVAMRLFNQVLVEDGTATPDAVADAVATMRAGSFRYLVHLRDGVDDAFVPLLAELGLVEPDPDDAMPGMALEPITDGAPTPPELDVRHIDDAAGFDDHIRMAALGFGLDEALIRSFLDLRQLDEPGVRSYVGYVDGEPVATGVGIVTGRTIGVYNIATIESARRRGYGAAMTVRAALDGRAAGCDVAILQASEMGRPIYERLGYRTVVRYRAFVDPEAPPGSAPPGSAPPGLAPPAA
ncbi:MAG TPA: GNAT family N-acetyltransferase [Candidatus Limnocylindrales bacterium]|nr:GNAT family N-acetyltransferase [Candidatus Limnocylindrales bacterium]